MDLKVLFGRLFATVLLLAPAVHGCLVFQASLSNPCNGKELFSIVVDNGYQMCTMKGPPSLDNMYHFTCITNHTAVFDPSTGVLNYNTTYGGWPIPTYNTVPGQVWTSCVFNCLDQQCWVKTPLSDPACSAPSPAR